MDKKRTKFDPLSNEGTSRVFFTLVAQPKTTATIARELDIEPPGVVEQLDRLREIGIVGLHKEEGRLRFYEIKWAEFARTFIEKCPSVEFARSGDERGKPHQFYHNIKKLGKNRCFLEMIKYYYQQMHRRTVQDTILEFEKMMLEIPGFMKKPRQDFGDGAPLPKWWPKSGSKEEMQELLTLLEMWREWLAGLYGPRSSGLFWGLTIEYE
jgi:hypothetical protein